MTFTQPAEQTTIVTTIVLRFSSEEKPFTDWITNYETRQVLELVFYASLAGVISALGSVFNVINITVFFKQGFSDSINISLCGLATSDLGSLLPLVWKSVCFNPLFQDSDIDFDPLLVQHLTSGPIHGTFTRVTCLLTAFITLERCVCIALPLNVKHIITPKRTLLIVISAFIVMLAVVSPVYDSVNIVVNPPQNKRNKSLIGLSYHSNGYMREKIYFCFNFLAQISSFIIVVVCSLILVRNLRSKSQWRQKAIGLFSEKSNSNSSRDQRIKKTVILIAGIFMTCFLPHCAGLMIMIIFNEEFRSSGPYENSYHATWSVLNTLEAVNGSLSIFVYYNTSTRFRTGLKNSAETNSAN